MTDLNLTTTVTATDPTTHDLTIEMDGKPAVNLSFTKDAINPLMELLDALGLDNDMVEELEAAMDSAADGSMVTFAADAEL